MAVYQSLVDGEIYTRPHQDFLNSFTIISKDEA